MTSRTLPKKRFADRQRTLMESSVPIGWVEVITSNVLRSPPHHDLVNL